MVLLVTYSLNDPMQNYTQFIDAIESYRGKKLSKYSYAIETRESPKEIFESLSQYLGRSDSIYVIAMKRPYFGHGPQDLNDWLKKELE